MKKRSNFKFINILLIFVILVSLVFVAIFAWAKYISSSTGQASNKVASWSFKVTANGEPINSQTINFAETRDINDTDSVVRGKIAPGTFGEFDLVVDTSGTEVLMVYDIKMELTNCPTNLRFYIDKDMQHEMKKTRISEDSAEGPILDELKISKFLTLDETKSNYVGVAHTEKIYWKWPFETGKTQEQKYINNLEDSNWKDIEEMTMRIEVTGVQAIDEPNQLKISNVNVKNENGGTLTATINRNTNDIADNVDVDIVLGESNATTTINMYMTNLSDSTYYLYGANLIPEGSNSLDINNITCNILDITDDDAVAAGLKLVPGNTGNFKVTFKYKDGIEVSSNENKLQGKLKFLILNDEIISKKLADNGYQRVEYIKNTSNGQYIDTKIVPNEHYGFYADICVDKEIDNEDAIPILGSSRINGGKWGGIIIGTYASKIGGQMTYFQNTERWYYYDPNLVAYQRMQIGCVNDVYKTSNGYKLNLTRETYSEVCGSVYIFSIHCEGGAFTSNPGLKLYEFRTYHDSNVIQYLVPCYRKSDNKVGLYDVIGNKFYENKGNGEFLKGGDV